MNRRIGPSRSIVYIAAASAAVIFFIFLYGTNNNSHSFQKVQRESYLLGTIVKITLYGNDSGKLNKTMDLAIKEIERLEGLLSVNIPSSDISRLNVASGKYSVKVSEETGFLLEKALKWSERTNGAFDPTIGKIVKLWGIGTENAAIPDSGQLKEAVSLTNFRKVSVVNRENGVFVKTAMGQRIDLGGIAKGYVTDKVRKLLADEGVSSALIDLGGNIAVLGRSPKQENWKIGLQHPFKPRGEYFGIMDVSDVSVVTSGPYERYFESGGVRYHHIFDPATGYPAKSDLASVTVISTDSTDADALSTALFVMGSEKGLSFLSKLKNIDAVLVVKKADGNTVYVTHGISGYFILKEPGMKKEQAVQD